MQRDMSSPQGFQTIRGLIQLPAKYAVSFFQDFEEVDTGECKLFLWAELSVYQYMGPQNASPLVKLVHKRVPLDEVLLHQRAEMQNTLNYNVEVCGMDFTTDSILVMVKIPVNQIRWELFGGSCDYSMFVNYPQGIGLEAYVDRIRMDWVQTVYWVSSIQAGKVWVAESYLCGDAVSGSLRGVPSAIHWTSEVDFAHQNNLYRFAETIPASAGGPAMAWIKRASELQAGAADEYLAKSQKGAFEALCQRMQGTRRTSAFG